MQVPKEETAHALCLDGSHQSANLHVGEEKGNIQIVSGHGRCSICALAVTLYSSGERYHPHYGLQMAGHGVW